MNTLWWFSKTEWPQADAREVLTKYSGRMKRLLQDSVKYYTPKERPSGHDISGRFATDNGGAIPSTLLSMPNSESNCRYLRHYRALNIQSHPARFPSLLSEFFIKFLTRPGDLVVDIFAGSNATGEAAERLGRRWSSCDLDGQYVASSVLRFVEDGESAYELYCAVVGGGAVVVTEPRQPRLLEGSTAYRSKD